MLRNQKVAQKPRLLLVSSMVGLRVSHSAGEYTTGLAGGQARARKAQQF